MLKCSRAKGIHEKSVIYYFVGDCFFTTSFSLVAAQSEKINLKGLITTVNEADQTITVRTEGEVEFTIHFSSDYAFNFTNEEVNTSVRVKGGLQEDGTILAVWVKLGDENGNKDIKEESVYCSGKKEKSHPAALFLSQTYDKDVAEIMEYFCGGFGFGQISLALQTEKVADVNYKTVLENRAVGKGWGEIWKEFGLKGNSKDDDKIPPGQEKHPNKDKDKDKNQDLNDDDTTREKGKKKK